MDLERVKEILALMDAHDLSEIELEDGEVRIRLKKRGANGEGVGGTVAVMPSIVQAAPPQAALGTASEPPPEPKDETVEIRSPMVGTFYRSSGPGKDPFVTVGDTVSEDTVVCIIEAMKVMNEIKAEIEGAVVEILVESGEALEYGQPLMLVKPSHPAA